MRVSRRLLSGEFIAVLIPTVSFPFPNLGVPDTHLLLSVYTNGGPVFYLTRKLYAYVINIKD